MVRSVCPIALMHRSPFQREGQEAQAVFWSPLLEMTHQPQQPRSTIAVLQL